MGTDRSARDIMVAELLVDGPVNITSKMGVSTSRMDCIQFKGNDMVELCPIFQELEGRRWQVAKIESYEDESISIRGGLVRKMYST